MSLNDNSKSTWTRFVSPSMTVCLCVFKVRSVFVFSLNLFSYLGCNFMDVQEAQFPDSWMNK